MSGVHHGIAKTWLVKDIERERDSLLEPSKPIIVRTKRQRQKKEIVRERGKER